MLDIRAVKPSIASTLFAGLSKPTTEQILLAMCCDRLSNVVWMLSKDGENGVNQPESVLDIVLGRSEKETDVNGYDTPEDFWEAMEKYG